MALTTSQLSTIQTNQENYFNATVGTLDSGTVISRNQYQQVLYNGTAIYWVNIYSGPLGQGFVIMEERTVNGTLQQKATNYGSENFRDHTWQAVGTA